MSRRTRYSRRRRRGGNSCVAAATTTASGGRRTRRRKCCKCKRKCGKTCTCKKNGRCLKRCHCFTGRRRTKRRRTKRRRTKRRRTKRRRTKRRRMRGGSWLNKATPAPNHLKLNNSVLDPPYPSRNDLNLPGVKIGGKRYQRGGGAMDIIPGWNDLRDIGRSVFTGSKNFYHQLNGDRSEPSPLPDRDQYIKPGRMNRDFPDIGGIHNSAEIQAAKYKLQ